MFSDILTTAEAELTRRAIEALAGVEWARPLLRRVAEAGGVVPAAMPLLFEVRFAYALHRCGRTAQYEYAAGVGGSTVEFRIPGARDWLVELVSVRESEAAKAAIHQRGPLYEQALTTPPPGAPRAVAERSTEAQMIKAQEKIGAKVFAEGQPTKFPLPAAPIHAILTDMRGYLPGGADVLDYAQIAWGPSGVRDQRAVLYWTDEQGNDKPIAGLFEESNPTQAARLVRERIHFLGFAAEQRYVEGELCDDIQWFYNPNLLASEAEVRTAAESLGRSARVPVGPER